MTYVPKPGDRIRVDRAVEMTVIDVSENYVQGDAGVWSRKPASGITTFTLLEDPWIDGDVATYDGRIRHFKDGLWYDHLGTACGQSGGVSVPAYVPIVRGGKIVKR